jgi:uncharacterized protein YciI
MRTGSTSLQKATEYFREENTMIYANHVEYGERAKILALRPAHQRYMFDLLDRGKAVAAGSFPDDVGGLYLYEVETQDAAESLMREDPYFIGGAIASYRIMLWEIHGANPSLLRVTGKAT